jgi:hypothetical protein
MCRETDILWGTIIIEGKEVENNQKTRKERIGLGTLK